MGDTGETTVPCHYCGADIDVPAERSRFEAFTTHFEAEHIREDGDAVGEIRRWRADSTTDAPETGN
jgi:hypothetical protein